MPSTSFPPHVLALQTATPQFGYQWLKETGYFSSSEPDIKYNMRCTWADDGGSRLGDSAQRNPSSRPGLSCSLPLTVQLQGVFSSWDWDGLCCAGRPAGKKKHHLSVWNRLNENRAAFLLSVVRSDKINFYWKWGKQVTAATKEGVQL